MDEQATAAEPANSAAESGPDTVKEAMSELASEDALATITESLSKTWSDFLAQLPFILAGLLVLVATWVIAKIVNAVVHSVLKRTKFGPSLKDLIKQIVYIGVWTLGALTAATVVFPGVTPVKILTVLGLSSIAIGFAFKDIVENFFAGVLILWRFPFDRDDFIECGDIKGKVQDVTIRMTQIRQTDGQLVVLPNAMLFKNPVNIVTSLDERRTTVICGVAYDEDVDESRSVIEKAVKSCRTVSKDQPVQVFAQEFAASSINFEVTWWTGSTPLAIRESRDEVVAAVKRALDDAGIEIPFPYRTLTFKEPVPMAGQESSESSMA